MGVEQGWVEPNKPFLLMEPQDEKASEARVSEEGEGGNGGAPHSWQVGKGAQDRRSEVSNGFRETEGQPREEINPWRVLGPPKGIRRRFVVNISGEKEFLRAAQAINK